MPKLKSKHPILNASPGFLRRIEELESKLMNTIELLHLWENEAHSYGMLAEAIISGRYTLAEASEALQRSRLKSSTFDCVTLQLTREEREAVIAIATFTQLPVHEFLWACLDCIMNHSDDEDVLSGCRETANSRFREGKLPEWGR